MTVRFDKRDYIWRGTLDVAAIQIWPRDPVHDPIGRPSEPLGLSPLIATGHRSLPCPLMTQRKRIKHIMAAAAISLLATTGLSLIAAPQAVAQSPYWAPVYSTCGPTKWVVLKFTITDGPVYFGTGNTPREASKTYYPTTLYPGTRYLYTGFHSLYWQKWASPGNVTSWTLQCVNYL